MKIGILGTGTITSAVVRGIAQDDHQITVSNRSANRARALSETFANVLIADNQGVLDQSDVVIVGLMADVGRTVLPDLTFRPDQQVISVMAGVPLDEVATLVAPAQGAAVMMPFPGIAQGGSPLMMQGDADLVGRLFGDRNTLYPLKNAEELSAYLCAQAVLSPVARMVDDAAQWLADRVDDPAQGEAFLRVLVTSSLHNTPAIELISALNTEGGYNQRLRQHMETAGTGAALTEGLNTLERDA
ncbi:pyrroline-5-carboxylate reductase [Thalassovita litoralis]|jgi:pyrroline-5-carboxylate reductase|uniref:Pyrroline-5-carboxylate reductase n=1 Tax=Thalassovita litoralis TaxID=1010611 RepID=A0A521EKX3_9RHOB|nr:NAD(P)-binding domain-containing protein [Thalassovita litoralis]SMO84564.1 pyrroline-5-carboxylate reductase [Thalassovita litoralis]